ncbi:gprs [Cordylochernes scorpioides]|uniref:Gprs n=1 Tax=Cordylochernes scorpioides TaxID=51811 RepID=A0ABY6JZZ7_9ARAC|nr:gprs [Cordylochernes scorpioides]
MSGGGGTAEAAAGGGFDEEDADFSLFENKSGLAEDMKFLASMPELCDVTFLVGDNREPVCAVKAVLAARSKYAVVFHKMLYGSKDQSNKEHSSKKNRESTKETKLKMFLKRSSEPLLNINFSQTQVDGHQTLIIEEFEPDVFRQLIEYIHTGCVTLQARTLLERSSTGECSYKGVAAGLMNAADYYGLDELRRACMGFVQCCITVDTVCALLSSAEKYIQYKCTKSLVQKVRILRRFNIPVFIECGVKSLEFVDLHGNEVLSLGSFALLPEHVVRLILCREELQADDLTKFHAVLNWSRRFCDADPGAADLREVMANFLEFIAFFQIPAGVLMQEVHPLGVVPDHVIMNALAYQADPSSVDPAKIASPNCFVRRSTRSMSIQGPLPPLNPPDLPPPSGSPSSTAEPERPSGRFSKFGKSKFYRKSQKPKSGRRYSTT